MVAEAVVAETQTPEPVAEPAPPASEPAPALRRDDLDGVDNLEQAIRVMGFLRNRMRAQILGRDEIIDLVLVALLADGHVLLEDFPGSGKTTLA